MSNIEYMVEFQRDEPLKDFVNEMTQNRIQATKDGIDELAQLYKVRLIFRCIIVISFSSLLIHPTGNVG